MPDATIDLEFDRAYFEEFLDVEDAVSAKTISVYIPHRLIQPTMTRSEFRALIS